ncbi:hypothetical protein M422DRAFT_24809 [Sphaerobolus stellatus SS14]|nr:hypothetical protein M422DRAFT_24809 [Sphaerobolus stellatus SS14]
MSDAPQFIRRVKSRGSRVREASPPPEEVQDSPTATPESVATKILKNKQKKAKPKSRLSFGTDDQESDGDVFKVKKSNLSRKLVLGSTPNSPSIPLPSTEQTSLSRSTGPTYTKAYLDELKASTPSTPANLPPDYNVDSDISMDASFDIDGAIIENVSEMSLDNLIPSESAINTAKEKRNRLKATGREDDYISLSLEKRDDMPRGPHPESRLMREEDEIGEGEDELAEYTGAQERIALGKEARKDEERKRRLGMVEMIEDADEQDEETLEWERAQIRRAAPVDDSGRGLQETKLTYKPAPIPVAAPIPTLSSAMSRLSSAMTSLTVSHASHTSALSSLAEERTALESKVVGLREQIEETEKKRGWFTAFREWVENVASFLDEKYPSLEKLEDEHVSLLSERYDMISKRRRLDDEDDVALFLGAPPPPPEPEQVDELGRTIPSQNNITAIRISRRSARANRKLLRRARNQARESEGEDGYSTDGSLPPTDADDFRIAIQKLEVRKEAVLADVRADDFRDPQLGLAKWFGEWRKAYEDIYVGAWGGLGLVAAWEFWSRLEMVGWDPIQDPSRGLDSFEWSIALHEYSRPHKAADMDLDDALEPEIGPGGDMVSSMVSQAVIPRLCKLIEKGALDPYCASHIRRMIDIAEQVEASVEQEGLRFQALLKSVSTVFRTAVTSTHELLIPSLGPGNPGTPFDPEGLRARRRFLARRIKLLTNLLKWRKYTGERFGLGEIATSLIRECILPVAERGWDIGGEEIVRKIVADTPSELIPVEVTRRLH